MNSFIVRIFAILLLKCFPNTVHSINSVKGTFSNDDSPSIQDRNLNGVSLHHDETFQFAAARICLIKGDGSVSIDWIDIYDNDANVVPASGLTIQVQHGQLTVNGKLIFKEDPQSELTIPVSSYKTTIPPGITTEYYITVGSDGEIYGIDDRDHMTIINRETPPENDHNSPFRFGPSRSVLIKNDGSISIDSDTIYESDEKLRPVSGLKIRIQDGKMTVNGKLILEEDPDSRFTMPVSSYKANVQLNTTTEYYITVGSDGEIYCMDDNDQMKVIRKQ